MKSAAYARIALATLIITVSATAAASKAKKKNPVLDRIKEAYKDVLNGNEDDLKNNKRLLAKYTDRLKQCKRSPSSDEGKQTRRIEAYSSLVKLYTDLVAANEKIIGMFEGTSKSTEVEVAMDAIPRIESSISRITRKDSKREWLTFGEVQQLRKKGWVFRTPSTKRLPYLRSYWREPTEAEVKKREKLKRKYEEAKRKKAEEKAAAEGRNE